MEVKEFLEIVWLSEEKVTIEKRKEWVELRYNDNMLDFRHGWIDVYLIQWDNDTLLFNLEYDKKNLIDILKKILQLN